VQVINSTAIESGYAGRDPQGGTSDGSLFNMFSFDLQSMVKDLLLVLEKKKKNKLQLRKWYVKKVDKKEDGFIERN